MVDGVSFTDGKHRFTGRILSNGEFQIRQGGSWFSRFSLRQKIAFLALIILTALDYGWKGFADFWYWIMLIPIIPFILCLSPSQKRFYGAEHEAVNLYGGQIPSVFHPGCGTNLILMILPGLFLELLPWGFWITLVCEAIYLLIVLKIVWPTFQRSLQNGNLLALLWWRLSRQWQRFFVAEPNDDEYRLAVLTLESLLKEGV
jgi:uncharacterized protein YqhQ